MSSMKALVIASEDAEKGVIQKRADFMKTIHFISVSILRTPAYCL
jgi:hypothetical protein